MFEVLEETNEFKKPLVTITKGFYYFKQH